jgi:hypothetical protein
VLDVVDELPPEDPPAPDELEPPEHPLEIMANPNVIAIAVDWTFIKRLLPILLLRGRRP